MEAKKSTINIQSKLNPELDADLVEEIEKITRRDRSRTYREALRFYFKYKDMADLIEILSKVPVRDRDRIFREAFSCYLDS